jgi:hypothetical protein
MEVSSPRIFSMRFEKFETGLRHLIDKEVSPADTVVEIGSYSGESTVMFAIRAKLVIAIDPWDMLPDTNSLITGHAQKDEMTSDMKLVEEVFDQRTRVMNNIEKMKAFDYEVVKKIKDKSVDFLYIDSIHTKEEVNRIIKLWLPKIAKHGKIAGHDYTSYFPGVQEAVDENFKKINSYIDTSWVALKEDYIGK